MEVGFSEGWQVRRQEPIDDNLPLCRFLAGWARRLASQGVAEAFGTTWQNVFRSVTHAVSWGLAHRELERNDSIGVDEVQWQAGRKYLRQGH